MPDAALSADAIVGFPGETEEQYARTESLASFFYVFYLFFNLFFICFFNLFFTIFCCWLSRRIRGAGCTRRFATQFKPHLKPKRYVRVFRVDPL